MANKPSLIGTSFRTTVNSFFLCNFFGGCAASSLHVRVGFGGCAAACFCASSIISISVGVEGATGCDCVSGADGGVVGAPRSDCVPGVDGATGVPGLEPICVDSGAGLIVAGLAADDPGCGVPGSGGSGLTSRGDAADAGACAVAGGCVASGGVDAGGIGGAAGGIGDAGGCAVAARACIGNR